MMFSLANDINRNLHICYNTQITFTKFLKISTNLSQTTHLLPM